MPCEKIKLIIINLTKGHKKMTLSKKHFEAVADIIASHDNINRDQKRSITNSFVKYFKTQNRNFCPFKFYNKSMKYENAEIKESEGN
tara:strand:- start:282 stop:542 length:261 start_codon:yes stop_codon:yes gene_type:complete